MNTTQITNNNPINQLQYSEKKQVVENKVKSIISQLPGKVRNISFMYNNKSVAKAKITIVVSSEEEAIKVRQNIDDEIDIKIIINEEYKNKRIPSKFNIQKKKEPAVKENNDTNQIPKSIYSFNRGPDGKIYGIIREKKDTPIDSYINSSKDFSVNDNLKNKYINIYKRYNFKNIKTKENQPNNRFSLNI